MAPRTRSSTGAANALASARTLSESKPARQQERDVAHTSINTSRRDRGGPPKNQTVIHGAGNSNSASSTLTPTTNTSDGEYFTPATSKTVTPAPRVKSNSWTPRVADSTATSDSSHRRPRRSRLMVELPDEIPSEDDGDDNKDQITGKPKLSSVITRSQGRARPAPSYAADSDEYDDLYGNDDSTSAALARRLQRVEDQKATVITGNGDVFLPHSNASNSDSSTDLSVPVKRKRTSGRLNPPLRKASSRKRNGRTLALRSHKKPKTSASNTTTRQSSTLDVGNSLEIEDDDQDFDNLSDIDSEIISNNFGAEIGDNENDATSVATPDPVGGRHSTTTFYPAPELRPYRSRRRYHLAHNINHAKKERQKLEENHPELRTMWSDLSNMPDLNVGPATQPTMISLQLKPFQLEGLAWMKAMEQTSWKGGLLGDEMGLGKTIQAVSLIMSDYPAKSPTLVLVPPVALGQWQTEIGSYTGNRLKTVVYHGTYAKVKKLSIKNLKAFDVIIMSYNSLEVLYRKQEKGVERKAEDEDGHELYKEKSVMHQIKFHRIILDEAHCIKTRTTMTARACFALKGTYRWCLTGTPLQNRIGEFFSLLRFLEMAPFASYCCKDCPCSTLEWTMNADGRCTHCAHISLRHISVFNQELLNPIQAHGNEGSGKEAFKKLRLLTSRVMLRRLKKDHTNAMELPVKEIYVHRQFFGEEETDFARSIMSDTQREFNTYVSQGVALNNYANIFGLIMQMRQVANHPDLILKKSGEGGQNILVCCICDEPAEQAIRSKCKHDFCRLCATSYLASQEVPDCPQCHISLSIDLEQPSIEQDALLLKKSSIINRIKMDNWTSSSKIELLVHELHRLRSDNASHKSIIFSQFTTMLQLIEWRLRRAGITTVMLDGSMTPAQRQASIKHFMERPEVECFLVSLRAGGVALNLTEASQVFIVDPWWNPAAEWQSADRCHRIGQARPCTITRLCIEDSVESRMVLLQEKKTHMIHSTINSDDKAMQSLSLADLSFLFRGS
ncbi:hypothetical protein F4861DRAFT_293568 [Xylaria intraflava]|nr:hypothetical protein F4861DRAFT_293568 [Xylaria intraflava]